eukprot:CAMPEP_0184748122 /NCGR_PEP_ID=MMETSP0315-20130426/16161_1 /TAXON_ID=101924 /ORGANISM="Rhodosorus marinus, Strain UTEX LB 2760" /LENGTH=76 /DNA_ID=CAMNT_0027222635 /DNA_START=295 /DNA_END=525 /DNA_ORIENTATION=-
MTTAILQMPPSSIPMSPLPTEMESSTSTTDAGCAFITESYARTTTSGSSLLATHLLPRAPLMEVGIHAQPPCLDAL